MEAVNIQVNVAVLLDIRQPQKAPSFFHFGAPGGDLRYSEYSCWLNSLRSLLLKLAHLLGGLARVDAWALAMNGSALVQVRNW